MPRRALLLSPLLALGLAGPALAQGFGAQPAQPQTQQPASAQTEGAPAEPNPFRFGSDDNFIEFAPFVQAEGVLGSSSPGDLITQGDESGGQIRRARLYIDFKAGDFGGRYTPDFASEDDRTTYAYVNYAVTDDLTVQFGQQDLIFSLQDLTGSRNALFNEDGDNETLQETSDRVGLTALYGKKTYSLSGGVYFGNINERPFDDGATVSARATVAPVLNQDAVIHLGLAARSSFDTRLPFGFDSSGGSGFIGASPVSAGDFEAVDRYAAGNFEFAATSGRFTVSSEYTLSRIDDAERPDAVLHGGYASALVFLTDDHRDYEGSSGTFDRIKPSRPVTHGGFGAVEVGARFDYLDLSDARTPDEDAGRQLGGTAIASWYLTSQSRLTASHTLTHVASGENEGADVNTTLLRLWIIY